MLINNVERSQTVATSGAPSPLVQGPAEGEKVQIYGIVRRSENRQDYIVQGDNGTWHEISGKESKHTGTLSNFEHAVGKIERADLEASRAGEPPTYNHKVFVMATWVEQKVGDQTRLVLAPDVASSVKPHGWVE